MFTVHHITERFDCLIYGTINIHCPAVRKWPNRRERILRGYCVCLRWRNSLEPSRGIYGRLNAMYISWVKAISDSFCPFLYLGRYLNKNLNKARLLTRIDFLHDHLDDRLICQQAVNEVGIVDEKVLGCLDRVATRLLLEDLREDA
jgi:hypothetical protein